MDKINLICLKSGSKGNCYILQNDNEALIIDAGVKVSEVKQALNFNILKVVGVVVTHSHGDHNAYANQLEKIGFKVFKPYEKYFKSIKLGGFTVRPFELEHSVPNYGFHINHEDIGNLIYITDTEYCKWKFKNINHMLLETNYDKNLLIDVGENSAKREHVLTGHMEIETSINFLRLNKNVDLKNVILCHLSDVNAEPIQFKARVEKVADCSVYVARKGLVVELDNPNRCPF